MRIKKISRRWCRMEIFYNHFYWFFTCLEKNYYLQVYLDNHSQKVVDKQMTDYLDDSLMTLIKIRFFVLINVLYKCCTTIVKKSKKSIFFNYFF